MEAWAPFSGPTSADAMRVKWMRVNNVDLAYVEAGKGPTVVFTHGACGDWRSWEPIRPHISASCRYVSLSRRFHHPNAPPGAGDDYSFDQNVEDLAGFIRGLGVGKVHFAGNSYGGRLAGYLAYRHPDLLRSVVLGEPMLIRPETSEGKEALATIRPAFAEVVAAAERGDAERAAILLYNAVMDDPAAFDRAPAEQRRRWLDNAATVGPLFRGSDTRPLTCEELRTLKVPALVLGGARSRASFRLGNDALMACLPPGTEQALVPDAPHIYAPANPEGTAEAVLTFIAKH